MKKLDETAFTERELKIFKEIQEYAKKYQTKKVVFSVQGREEPIVKRAT